MSEAPRLELSGRVSTGRGILPEATVVVEAGRIVSIGRAGGRGRGERIDAGGGVIAPGFIDLQVNGFGGDDAAEGVEAMVAIARALPRTGVTSFLPTAISAPPAAMAAFVADSAAAARAAGPDAARILGAHLEGPFLNPIRAGAHDPARMLEPRPEHLDRLLAAGAPRLLTMAPELPGALEAAARLDRLGVVVSAGHSEAGLEQARAALAAGFSFGTHLFNAMSGTHHRHPGLAAALLESATPAGLIADGRHVDPALLELAIRLKGRRAIALTTDQAAPAGAPPGRYRLGGAEVVSDGDTIRRGDGTLAGSCATMERLVQLVAALPSAGPAAAIEMATATPARVLGLSRSLGSLRPGRRADLVVLDEAGRVRCTLIGGRVAFRS